MDSPETTVKFARIQSPSSINLYKQCPRRYYYSYIKKYPTKPSIYLIRGSIVHSVLEDFFKLDPNKLSTENFDFVLKIFINDLLNQHWIKSKNEFNKLDMDQTMLDFYLMESRGMVKTFINNFLFNLDKEIKIRGLVEGFKKLTPITEKLYRSEKHGVRGYIDAIQEIDGEVSLIDYKTSKSRKISDAYKLQLALYAMMYEEKHGVLPARVGINFLKFGEDFLEVDRDLVNLAKLECELIHMNTQSKEKEDYPKKKSGLCKWRNGQCDFYHLCK